MKIQRLVLPLLALIVIMLGSCSGENKGGGFGIKGFGADQDEDKIETGAKADSADEYANEAEEFVDFETEEAEEPVSEETKLTGDLASYVRSWDKVRIKVDGGSSPNVRMFAKALCRQFNGYGPAEALENYTTYPNDYDYNEDLYQIEDKTSNGYIHCTGLTQFQNKIACCYWRRSNGHRLVALWIGAEKENPSLNKHLLAFYDFDPSTGYLTPEKELTRKVDNKVRGYDSYVVDLPIEGKNIIIQAFNYDYDGDSANSREFKLRWNGDSFNL
ncbi:MAG: hypothetical protein IK092_03045 [Muribaculaceae bacterium]|nr:hypothetical protein [Muribaculaceae bacterium]